MIDGSLLLFQMFYGMPSRIIYNGKAIQGVMGFVGALIKILKMVSPTHLLVIFDGEHENARSDINAEYKANRTDYSQVGDEENPFSQLDDIYKALDHMGIRHTETTEFESDDVIASYAIRYSSDTEIVICSWDSDFFQLINENVSVLRYRGKMSVFCGVEYIKSKFGISPEAYAGFKSLTGDKSDNIKGIYGVGEKTASALINEFGTLDALIGSADMISKPSVRAMIKENAERLCDNYRLIRLTDSAPLPFDISELEYTAGELNTRGVLRGIALM